MGRLHAETNPLAGLCLNKYQDNQITNHCVDKVAQFYIYCQVSRDSRLHSSYFIYAALVSAALKFTGEKGVNDFPYRILPSARSEAEDIGVIMLACPLGREGIVNQGGSYPFDFISCNTHTDTGAAYQDTAVKIVIGHGARHFVGNIRVVNRLSGKTAQVLIAMAGIGNLLDDRLLQL